MRNLDLWNRYLDNSGKILQGCIQVMVKDGNTNADIYDSDGTAIQNPQLTDEYGRSEKQIFIEEDVVAYFYKYIGNGSFADIERNSIDTSDTSLWLLQYTGESQQDLDIHITGDAAMAVDSIASLRSLNPTAVPEINQYKVITLLGYNSAGDKEPINYIWNDRLETNDNGGSVIKANDRLTGRWIMVCPTEHCDCRHFGVFPSNTQNMQDQTSQMSVWFQYCDEMKVRPYFSGYGDYKYYKYDSLNATVDEIDIADGVKFIDSGNSSITGEWNGDPFFINRSTVLNCKTVRLSWQMSQSSNFDTMIVDTNYPINLQYKHVIFEVSPNTNTRLFDCDIESVRKFNSTITIENTELKEEWFTEDYDWSDLQSFNNRIVLTNFNNPNNYIILKNKQNESNYGDLNESTITGQTLLAGCVAENASFINVTLAGNAELHNVSGGINVAGTTPFLNFIDCWLNITNGSQLAVRDFALRRGSITSSVEIQALNSLYLENVEVHATFNTPGIEPQYINCSIYNRQNLYRQVKMIGCRIHTGIYQYPEEWTPPSGYDGYYWCGEFFSNIFLGENAKVFLSPVSGADYYATRKLGLYGKFCNNLSDHKFIDDSLWNGVAKSGFADNSGFKYQGNSGGCPVFQDEITYSIPYSYKPYWHENSYYCSNVPDTKDSTGVWVVKDARTSPERDVPYDVYWIINLKNSIIPIDKLFRLPYLRPNDTVIVEADVEVFVRPDGYEDWPFYVNNFHISSAFLNNVVRGNVSTASISTFRPLKFHYCGTRYCDHDDIDDWESSLTSALWWTTEEPSKFGFAGSIKYRYHFGTLGKTNNVM